MLGISSVGDSARIVARAAELCGCSTIWRKYEIDVRKSTESATIICKMSAAQSSRLAANQKIRQDRLAILCGRIGSPENSSSAPCCIEIQWNSCERFQVLIHCLSRAVPGRKFSVRDRTNSQFLLTRPMFQALQTD